MSLRRHVLIALLILVPVVVLAGPMQIVLRLYCGASAHDKQAAREGIYLLFNDRSMLDMGNLGKDYRVSNTNIVCWRLVVFYDQVVLRTGADSNNVTKAAAWEWVGNHFDNTNHFDFFVLTNGGWSKTEEYYGFKALTATNAP